MASSLEYLIGSKLVIGVPGTRVTKDILQHFKDTHAGGIIFYRINFESPEQIKKFISDLENGLGRRILVCVDHEGGRVIMYGKGVTIFPDNLAFGHAGDPMLAQQAGTLAANELRALGTDINFSPVLDVLTDSYSPNIGIRSFGKDWKMVSEMGRAYIRGLQKGGVSATIKHFPGKGHAPVDAHLTLPTIHSTWEEMKAVHLQPFLAAIAEGVDCVMTSHPFYPNLDPIPNNIATFSRKIVFDYLRKELGYQGLIVSDDLEMGAIKDVAPIGVAAVKTVAAGHDLVLSCHDLKSQREVFDALLNAYKAGELSREELDESADRIEKIKAKRPERFSGETGTIKGGAELALFVSKKGLRVVQDSEKRIPIRDWNKVAIVFPQLSSFASKIMIEEEFTDEKNFLHMRTRAPEIGIYPIDPTDDDIKSAAAVAKKGNPAIFFCYDAHLHPRQLNLLKAVQEANKNLIVALMRDPYDTDYLRSSDACLNAFGWRKCQIEAILDRLHG
jgi:beta-N-acetylhexosaminidase